MKIKVAQFGLGPIGVETLKLAATKPWIDIVGGVDIDPNKIGKSLTEVTGVKGLEKRMVYPSFAALHKKAKPQVVLHTAVSRMKTAIGQLEPIAKAGVSVVSSCEELLFPQLKNPALARKLDAACKKGGARMLGTGVNPGFVMDTLAVCLTGVCRSVEKIEVERVVNASLRREPLQRKIGSGLQPDEFRKLFRQEKMGHVGLVESIALIAHVLGWKIGKIKETCEPMIAPRTIKTQFLEVPKGLCCGIHHRAEASDGKKKLVLDLKMYLDAENPRDAVKITGDPEINAILHGGVHGDRATVAALVNAVPVILKAPAGLLLVTDVPVPRVG